MKRLLAVAAFSVLGLSSNAYSQPVNLGFETGDTSGWVEDGAIDVVTSWTGPTDEGGYERPDIVTYTPVDGNYFAILTTVAGDFTTLSQSFSLNEGETVEGWATFCCGDEVYFPYSAIDASDYNDYALISVLNGEGDVVAEPWYADSFDLGYKITTPEGEYTGEEVDLGPLPWEHWSWTASATGTYTLQYQVKNAGDGETNSYAFFDDPPTAVPEPSVIALLGIGLAGVMVTRIRREGLI